MRKDHALERWRNLPPGQDPLPLMQPIPYKTEGSRYGCCGIRIDGSPEFIDAVLSNLKTLLAGENVVTRLELSRNRVARREGYNAGQNADTDAECCYVRLHQRGHEGSIGMAYFGDRQTKDNTRQYALALGVNPDD